MNSLFRIDRNSIHSSEIETAGMVVIPGFHELTEDQRTEKEQPKVRDAKQEDPIDAKKAELNRLERQVEEVKEQAAQMIADAQSKADGR